MHYSKHPRFALATGASDNDEFNDDHWLSNISTPLRLDAFALSNDEKEAIIAEHFHAIMSTLGLDMTDDSLKGTPARVAKMYVREIFKGLNPAVKPQPTLFNNRFGYHNMLLERQIPVQSTCEHHFLPIFGVAHVAYFPAERVIGLSKLNRIVDYYARRPQVQERLTRQIAEELRMVLGTEDVAVYIDAAHMCVQARGIGHHGCSTVTSDFGGKFLNEHVKQEFLSAIRDTKPY